MIQAGWAALGRLLRVLAALGVLGGLGVMAPSALAADSPSPARDSQSELGAQIEAFVRGRVAARGTPARVEVPRLADFAPPEGADPGALRTQLRMDSDGKLSGSLPVTVIVSDGEREIRRGVVTVQVVFERTVWVAARPLSRGQAVTTADLVQRRMAEERIPADAVARAEELEGLRARRSVAEGAVLRRGWLVEPLSVARGDLVSLLLRRGPLRIEARGRARDDGHTGEWIRVQNVDSRRELMGRVGSDGAIHVDF